MILFGECIYSVHSQPSHCLTIPYHPMMFWMMNYICMPACNVIPFGEYIYTVHSQPSYWFWMINYSRLQWYLVVKALTQYTVNPRTVWPFKYYPLWFLNDKLFKPALWWMHLHSTQSTLLLFNFLILTTMVLNDKLFQAAMISCVECMYTVHSQPTY